ncbi:MAG: lamin tail domain-containing protein [Algicola sp.]|nr:lamin tail domain-containing protein [Algicola sp.]
MNKLIWGVVGLLAILAGSAKATINDLFISEYVEGRGYNKAIELYNGKGHTIDLSEYQLEFYLNGASTASFSIELSGSLTAYTTFVIANSLAASEILIVTDQTRNGIWFDGDDVVTLTHKNKIIDSIGQVGMDPGNVWGKNDSQNKRRSFKNGTVRRLPEVEQADVNILDNVDFDAQWQGVGEDNFDGLGSYIILGNFASDCTEADKLESIC